jgi:hypothetical protein
MTARNLYIRFGGVAAIAVGIAACLWLRSLSTGQAHEPTPLEFLLVLASFVFPLGGLIALLNGERLMNPPARHGPEVRSRWWERSSYVWPVDDRARLADMLARRAARKRRR